MPHTRILAVLVAISGALAAAAQPDPKVDNPFLGLNITVRILSDQGIAEERLRFSKDEVTFANSATGVGLLPYTRTLLNKKPAFVATTGEGVRSLTWRGTLDKANGQPDQLEGTIEVVAGEGQRKVLSFSSKPIAMGADGKPTVLATAVFEGKTFAIDIMNEAKVVVSDKISFKDGIASSGFNASLGFAATFPYRPSIAKDKSSFSGSPPEVKETSLTWRGTLERIDNVDVINGTIELLAADNTRKLFTYALKGLLGPDGRLLNRAWEGKSYNVEITDVKGRIFSDRLSFAKGLFSARTNSDFGLAELPYTVTGKYAEATGTDAAGNSVTWKASVDNNQLTGFVTISPKTGDKQRWSFAPKK